MNETLRTINNLHSTHNTFSARMISEDDIETVVKASVRAANASNRQSYSIIIVKGAERVKEITGFASAPVAMIYCVDFNRIIDVGERLGYPSDYDNMLNYLTAHTDAALAAQTAVIAAESLGIGSLITNSILTSSRKNMDELYEQLNLPAEHCFPILALVLGYSTEASHNSKGRLCAEGIVHENQYQRLTKDQTEAIIKTVNDPANNFGSAGSCEDYLTFYYSKWAAPKPKEDMEVLEAPLKEHLKGFLRASMSDQSDSGK